jgi:hypothetical protein
MNEAKKATPHKELMRELLDSNEPKTAREHAAVRAIEDLLEALRICSGFVEAFSQPEVRDMVRAAIAKAKGEA